MRYNNLRKRTSVFSLADSIPFLVLPLLKKKKIILTFLKTVKEDFIPNYHVRCKDYGTREIELSSKTTRKRVHSQGAGRGREWGDGG